MYLALWAWLRITLYWDDKMHPPHSANTAPAFNHLCTNTGEYHGLQVRRVVTVSGGSNPLLDFWGIDNLLVTDGSGASIRLFGKFSNPGIGRSMSIEADFRQLPEHWPFNGCGLMLRNWDGPQAETESPDSPDPAVKSSSF